MSVFRLGDRVSIGSAEGNEIRIEEEAVSERHCLVELADGRYVLRDLDSRSGTFVNGIPVKEREVVSGDEVAVGNTVFLFSGDAQRLAESSEVTLNETAVPKIVQQVRYEELTFMRPESLAALPATERMARNLSVLLRISTGIGAMRDAELLTWTLLGMVFDVIPAERGAILLMEEGTQEIVSHTAWDRVQGPDHAVQVSQGVLQRVMEERISILENEGNTEGGAGERNAQSILCAPLAAGERLLGLLYLDTANPATQFSEEDLELLSAIAGLAAMGIENARQFERLKLENEQLRAEVSLTHDMVGRSARMKDVYQFIERVAPSDATVLIHGESGTGKELAARAIHKNSPRKNEPFVALNCAAFTETLLESELFGHEKGAFTSAICQKKGFLEVAEGGTVFLDEVGELSPILQAKLLRVLQEREFMRVGGTRPIKINVRFLAATNRDLQKAVKDGGFRGDLFHRLNVISMALPALREHPEDIPLLAQHFAARHAEKCSRVVRGISEEARACLMRYEWPGNIRELENAIERAVVVGTSEWILPDDLPEMLLEMGAGTSGGREAVPTKYHEAVRQMKKEVILSALEKSGGSITEAARALGVHGNYLHRLMRNLDVRAAMKKQNQA
jgi:transcriptional regulator with GAF, ATPase, and Fis domain